MKKIILSSLVATAMFTSAQADFSFGDMFKDMKEAAVSMSHDAKDSVTSMKDGAVETSKSAERTVTSVSTDAKDTSIKVSDDIKTVEVNTTKDITSSTTAISTDAKDSLKTTTVLSGSGSLWSTGYFDHESFILFG